MDTGSTFETELQELRNEVAALRAELTQRAKVRSSDGGGQPGDEPTGRRSFVRRAGMAAAAGLVGAAAAISGSEPAAAATAFNLNDTGNAANSPSGVAVSGNSIDYGIGVTDNGLTLLPALVERSALIGHAKESAFAQGVAGYAAGEFCVGVIGYADGKSAIGVYGVSQHNTGMVGFSPEAVGGSFQGGRAALLVGGNNLSPLATSNPHIARELDSDMDHDLWFCVADGTPGTWRKLAGPATAGSFHILPATVRVYDSRTGLAPTDVTKGKIDATAERAIDMTHASSGVPVGATAVMVNLTATNTDGSGYLALFKNGIAWPGNSSINWDHVNQTTANLAVVALDTNAKISVHCLGQTDFVLDVIGYYQ